MTAKKLPDPPRDSVKDQKSLFSDRELWDYKYGRTPAHPIPKPRKS